MHLWRCWELSLSGIVEVKVRICREETIKSEYIVYGIGQILERINHAKAVKQAKRAGVSTEGTTEEILDRINHAKVVKQAKRAGVSTEGTTKEILERIKQKNIDKHKK